MTARGTVRLSPHPGRAGERRVRRIERELGVLRSFMAVYCRAHHRARPHLGGEALCDSCAELLAYAAGRLKRCPYDPKPSCRNCPTHCYRAEERARMKRVMRYSGMYFVRRGRLDWLLRYFLQ